MEKPVNVVLIFLLVLVVVLIVFLFIEFEKLDVLFEDDFDTVINFTLPQEDTKDSEPPKINNTKPILITPTENSNQQKYSLKLLPTISYPNWQIIETAEYSKQTLAKGIVEKVSRHYSNMDGIIFYISVLRAENADYALQFYNKDMFNFYMMQNQTDQHHSVIGHNDVVRHVDADQCYAYKVELFEINYNEFTVNCIKKNYYFQTAAFINGTNTYDNSVLDLVNEISINIDSLE